MKKRIAQFFIVASLILGAKGAVFGQGTWAIDSSAAFLPRRSFSSDVIGNKLYVIGGIPNDAIQIFDPIMHTWSTPSTTGSAGGGCSAVVNGKIYVVGEDFVTARDSAVFIFDPSTNIWSRPVTNGTYTWRQNFTVATIENKIYAIGGEGNINGRDTILNTLEVFDPSTSSWSTPITTGKFTARSGLTSSVVNSKIYVIGGDTGLGQPCNLIEVFDPSTNVWSTPATSGTLTARGFLTSSVVNDKIYVIGGDLGGSIHPSNLLEIFDPTTNTWTEGPPMPTSRMQLSSAVVDGKVYALGGYTPHEELNSVEVFTPSLSGVAYPVSNLDLSIFPNPTPGLIVVRGAEGTITVTNVLGQVVFTASTQPQESLTLNLTNEPAGIYFVRTGEKSSKVIVSH